MDLHHVALASHDAGALVDPLVARLAGTVLMGGENIGFRSYQVRLGDAADGMILEVLEPWGAERFDFLARFLDRHGEGPHHLTFKVKDLEATLERVRAAGYTPVGVSLENPRWKEAFLQPREAHGTVVQLAQAESPFADFAEEWEHLTTTRFGEPVWWPDPPAPAPRRTVLRRVVMATPALDAALGFFGGLLGGTPEDAPRGVGRAADLVWPGGGRVRLEETPGTTPRVDRLELDAPKPDELDEPATDEADVYEFELAGTRFVVEPPADTATGAPDAAAGGQSLR